jgi:hypothetical protein
MWQILKHLGKTLGNMIEHVTRERLPDQVRHLVKRIDEREQSREPGPPNRRSDCKKP